MAKEPEVIHLLDSDSDSDTNSSSCDEEERLLAPPPTFLKPTMASLKAPAGLSSSSSSSSPCASPPSEDFSFADMKSLEMEQNFGLQKTRNRPLSSLASSKRTVHEAQTGTEERSFRKKQRPTFSADVEEEEEEGEKKIRAVARGVFGRTSTAAAATTRRKETTTEELTRLSPSNLPVQEGMGTALSLSSLSSPPSPSPSSSYHFVASRKCHETPLIGDKIADIAPGATLTAQSTEFLQDFQNKEQVILGLVDQFIEGLTTKLNPRLVLQQFTPSDMRRIVDLTLEGIQKHVDMSTDSLEMKDIEGIPVSPTKRMLNCTENTEQNGHDHHLLVAEDQTSADGDTDDGDNGKVYVDKEQHNVSGYASVSVVDTQRLSEDRTTPDKGNHHSEKDDEGMDSNGGIDTLRMDDKAGNSDGGAVSAIQHEQGQTPKEKYTEEFCMTPDNFEFCCAYCKCDESKKRFEAIEEGDFEPPCIHRPCCHGIGDAIDMGSTSFKTTYMKALDRACRHAMSKGSSEAVKLPPDFLDRKKRKKKVAQAISKREVRKLFENGIKQEAIWVNECYLPTPQDIANTDQTYVNNRKSFQKHADTMARLPHEERRPITVLDCFSGIGTLLVVLKRLGIRIRKIITVEKDPVAEHVFRYNHDPTYNRELPQCEASAEIEFVYYKTFEEVFNNLEEVMKQHGPIDFVGGGPPCQSFTEVNANRAGINDQDGQLFLLFGKFIKEIQKHTAQKGTSVFYFVENVQLRREDLKAVEEVFSCGCALLLDAKHWSPCNRKRMFITNLPCPESNEEWESIGGGTCLEKGWMLPGDVFRINDNFGLKANTFMASLGRIDDERMCTVREKLNASGNTTYHWRRISVRERERMMGYPESYVEGAVDKLFEILQPAYCRKKGYKWFKDMQDQYRDLFSGENNSNLRGWGWYNGDVSDPCLELKLAPPQSGKSRSFFDAEGYAKHLVGNAYSVPVAEALLAPLKEIYLPAHYEKYSYPYHWER